jgi:O-antigen ligase
MKLDFLISRLKAWGARISNSELLGFFIELDYLAIVFLVPLWFAAFYSGFNIFELDKLIVFRVLLWLLLVLTSTRILFFPPAILTNKSGRLSLISAFKKYFLIPLILIVGLFAILPFSLDWQTSFLGSYDRQEGIASQGFYFLWLLVLFFNLISWKNIGGKAYSLKAKIRRLLVVANLSASLVAIYGILQILNIDFLTWPDEPYLTGRAISTFGQPNFFASFLLLTIPLAIYLAYSSRHFRTKAFFTFTAVFQILGLFSSASRGGLVSLLAIGFLFLAYLFFVSKLRARAKIIVSTVAAFILILGIIILEIFTPGRLRESFNLGAGSFAARINFFQAASDAILEKPVFGYGLENSGEVFIKYYDNDWGIYADVSSNTDRAHNLILDILLNAGFFGLLLFSLWYYSFFKLAFLNYRLAKNKNLTLAIAAGALGYLISLLFSFAIVAAEVYFWFFFALLAALNFNYENSQPLLSAESRASALKSGALKLGLKISILMAVLIIASWQIVLNARVLIADAYFNDIYKALSRGEAGEAIILHDNILALKVNSRQTNFISHFLGDNLDIHLEQAPDLSNKTIIKERLAKIARDLPDSSYRHLLLKAKIFSELSDYGAADKYFILASQSAPGWPLVSLERGRDFMRRGQLLEAEAAYKLVDSQLPDVYSDKINGRHKKAAQSYRYMMYTDLGRAYLSKGEYARAENFFRAAYANMIVDYSLLKKIADTYYLRGDLDTALRYVAHGSVLSPKDYNWQVALASLYFEKGDYAAAAQSIEAAIRLAPDKLELIELKEKYKK